MTLARQAAPAAQAALVSAPASAPTVARSIVADVAGPSVQASPLLPAIPLTPSGPTATATVQRLDGAAPPPPAESEGHSEEELDELARALFGRFRNRLRSEYIHEREAKGLIFDNA
jgi:hypothetical protein